MAPPKMSKPWSLEPVNLFPYDKRDFADVIKVMDIDYLGGPNLIIWSLRGSELHFLSYTYLYALHLNIKHLFLV